MPARKDAFAQMDPWTARSIEAARKEGYRQGLEAAASIADGYNASTIHPYQLGDCILGKFNVRKQKARKNKSRIVGIKGKMVVCADGKNYEIQ